MNFQRGFAWLPFLLGALLVTLIMSGGAYWYVNQKPTPAVSLDSQLQPAATSTIQKQQITQTNASSEVCEDLSTSDKQAYNYWKKLYQGLHSDYDIYDAGSLCALSDGTTLVSFSYWYGSTPTTYAKAGQSIVLFDVKNALLGETQGLYQQTLGDLGSPILDSVSNGVAQFHFSSGDGGYSIRQDYTLALKDLSYTKIRDVDLTQ